MTIVKKNTHISQAIADMRSRGIVAWHADDAWHSQSKKIIVLAQPFFNDGPRAGDLVAIGDNQDDYETVVVVHIEPRLLPYIYYRNV